MVADLSRKTRSLHVFEIMYWPLQSIVFFTNKVAPSRTAFEAITEENLIEHLDDNKFRNQDPQKKELMSDSELDEFWELEGIRRTDQNREDVSHEFGRKSAGSASVSASCWHLLNKDDMHNRLPHSCSLYTTTSLISVISGGSSGFWSGFACITKMFSGHRSFPLKLTPPCQGMRREEVNFSESPGINLKIRKLLKTDAGRVSVELQQELVQPEEGGWPKKMD
ncbi:hypothetical protein BDR05DRAFT_986805 [Suillus weaverae]|nr:hypothetical protein BDR05DRAFT_986805 [Suillus weaverae]